VEDMKRA
jgi:hypothetical protein